MKSISLCLLLIVGAFLAAYAAERSTQPQITHIDSAKVTEAFAKGVPILITNNFKIQAGRRTGPGEVEMHDRDTDIFYVLEGSAVLVAGGQTIAPRPAGPGETRGREIKGGESTHLNKGDVLVIPNGIPHWFKQVDGLFLYYVVKVTQ